MGNLAHFEHKSTLFNMDNAIFSLTSGAHAAAAGEGKLTGATTRHFINHALVRNLLSVMNVR